MSQDPAQADADLYRYCGNDPTSLLDPSGLGDDASGGGTGNTGGGNTQVNGPATEQPEPTFYCSIDQLTPEQAAVVAVSDAIRKAEDQMLANGWQRAAGSRDTGAYGDELSRLVQENLKGQTPGGGSFMFNTGVNETTKKVAALNVTNGTEEFADIDIMWLKPKYTLSRDSTVNPANVLPFELKTSAARSIDTMAWDAQKSRYAKIFGSGRSRLAMSRYGLQQSTGKMIPNPNYSTAFKIFGICGMAAGAYELLTVDSAQAQAAEANLTQELGRLRNASFGERGPQRRAVIAAAKNYLDTVTGENIENITSAIQWQQVNQTLIEEYGNQ